MYYVYILKCENDCLYTGITTDITRRISEHRAGLKAGAKFTKSHKPISVEVLYEAANRSDASKVESFIKSMTRHEKDELIKKPESLTGRALKLIGVEVVVSNCKCGKA